MKLKELKRIVEVFSNTYSDNEEVFAIHDDECEEFMLNTETEIINKANEIGAADDEDDAFTDVDDAILYLTDNDDSRHYLM